MPAKKNSSISIPLNFEAQVIIPESAFEALDRSIERGEICIGIDLVSGSIYFGVTIYPDSIDGAISFVRRGPLLKILSSGSYKMTYGEFEREHLQLPAKVVLLNVLDDNADAYYFGVDEEGIDLNVTIDKLA
jgi:hypothetical protein